MPRILVLVGTRKGFFVLSSGVERRDWSIEGPHFALVRGHFAAGLVHER